MPKSITELDVERLLAAPEAEDPVAQRDRAMLELLYACGLRVTELVQLRIDQVNLRQGVVRVTGKGKKERLVPMGEQAQDVLSEYLTRWRGVLLGGQTCDAVFPSSRGQLMTRQTFWHRIKHWATVADISIHLSPHTLRHAFALLLNESRDFLPCLLPCLRNHARLPRSKTIINEHCRGNSCRYKSLAVQSP